MKMMRYVAFFFIAKHLPLAVPGNSVAVPVVQHRAAEGSEGSLPSPAHLFSIFQQVSFLPGQEMLLAALRDPTLPAVIPAATTLMVVQRENIALAPPSQVQISG